MKVAVISRHSVANYGSLWQAYALQNSIEKLGVDAININYTPEGEVAGNLAKTLCNKSRWGKNPVTKLGFMMYQYPSFSHTFRKFEKFRKLLLKETKAYFSCETLRQDLPLADIYCTGSDQVWNVLYDGKIDDTYFLSFLTDEARRIAYAASFGGNTFESVQVEKYHELLSKYEHITVREDKGVEILHVLGLEGEQVLDPTLLLSTDEWNKIIPNKKCKEKYILIYQLRPNKEFDKYAKQLAKKNGLKLIRVSPMFFQIVKSGRFRYLPKPEEFLWLIKNATCMVTDSFHGTCFAINLRTPFIEILPGRFNSRNQSLLRSVGLESRVLSNYEDFSLINQEVDYNLVHEKLVKLRDDSICKLKSMIGV